MALHAKSCTQQYQWAVLIPRRSLPLPPLHMLALPAHHWELCGLLVVFTCSEASHLTRLHTLTHTLSQPNFPVPFALYLLLSSSHSSSLLFTRSLVLALLSHYHSFSLLPTPLSPLSYVALCYCKLDYYDVSLEILQVYLDKYPDSSVVRLGIGLFCCLCLCFCNCLCGRRTSRQLRAARVGQAKAVC